MWEQYKSSFWRTQALIALIAYEVLDRTHSWPAVAMFVLVMQLSAVLGARWALRLTRKLQREPLPLR